MSEQREMRGALCPYCGHRAIWHHDARGCGYHGHGKSACPCACDSDMVVEQIAAEAKAEALREAADELDADPVLFAGDVGYRLRERADRIEAEQ